MTRSGGKSPSPIASSASSSVSGIGPGRASRMCQRRFDARREHEEAARALERRRLRADVDVRVAELAAAAARNSSGEVAAIERGIGTPQARAQLHRPGLVVAGRDRLGRGDEHGHRELVERACDTARPRTTTAGRPRRRPPGARARPGGRGTRRDEPGGTTWKASQRDRPPRRALMSVPTTASSRSPFCCSDCMSRPPPGEPAAVTSTRSGRSRSWLSLVASPSRADPCGMDGSVSRPGSPSGLPADGREC